MAHYRCTTTSPPPLAALAVFLLIICSFHCAAAAARPLPAGVPFAAHSGTVLDRRKPQFTRLGSTCFI
jgi:hypothetical protein